MQRAAGVATRHPNGGDRGVLVSAGVAPLVRLDHLLPMSVALPMFLMGSGAPWQLIAVAALIPGVLQAVYYVLWTTGLQERFATDVLVRGNSWNMVTSYALMPLIMLISGFLASAFGAEKLAFWSGITAVVSTLSALVVIHLVPEMARPSIDNDAEEAIA